MKKFNFTIQGNKYEVDVQSVEENIAEVEVNGTVYRVEVDRTIQTTKTPKIVRTKVESVPQETVSISSGKGGVIKSPLPGVVLNIYVKVGDSVKVGQKIMLLEAMKMENNLDSDKDGVVKAIKVNQGDAVMEGDVLIEIE